MRLREGLLLALFGAVATMALGGAPAAAQSCEARLVACLDVAVPLDRSGAVPGAIRLHVKVERAEDPVASPLLAIGGGPGQASTEALQSVDLDSMVTPRSQRIGDRIAFPGASRDLVTMDLRGTGRSGALRCDALQRLAARGAKAAAECAASLGLQRGLFTASHSADDIEAVRKAIGAEKIALLGDSYGARVALAYAQRYPDRVDRLVLQSPPSPEGADLFLTASFGVVPKLVAARCRRDRCRRASRSPVADLVSVAHRLARAPIAGSIVDGSGRRRRASVNGFQLFQLAASGFPYEWELPGLVRNARRGDVAPLLRALQVARWYEAGWSALSTAKVFSAAAYAASVCEESVLPWKRNAALTVRDAEASAFVAGLPPAVFEPFGPRTALESSLLELCREWPVASSAPAPLSDLPAVPTLVVAGDLDVAAPIVHAEAVTRLIPGARLLRVTGTQPSYSGPGYCPSDGVRSFLAGGAPPASCRSFDPGLPRATPPPPLALAEVDGERGTEGRAGRTLTAVRLTLRDGAEAVRARFFARLLTAPEEWSARRLARRLYGASVRVGALRAGAYRLGFRHGRYSLRAASYVPGVAVTGALAASDSDGDETPLRGHLRVRGPAAARGRLVVRDNVVSGRLGDRPVRMRIGDGAFPDVSFGR